MLLFPANLNKTFNTIIVFCNKFHFFIFVYSIKSLVFSNFCEGFLCYVLWLVIFRSMQSSNLLTFLRYLNRFQRCKQKIFCLFTSIQKEWFILANSLLWRSKMFSIQDKSVQCFCHKKQRRGISSSKYLGTVEELTHRLSKEHKKSIKKGQKITYIFVYQKKS